MKNRYRFKQFRGLCWLLILLIAAGCSYRGEDNPLVANQATAYPGNAPIPTQAAFPSQPPYPEPSSAPTKTPLSDTEQAIHDLLAQYGWTINHLIAVHTETLPATFEHRPGDFPIAIYWAYNNEFSKAIGLNLAPYLGQQVQASLYQLNEPLPDEFLPYTTARAVVIAIDGMIIGAWIDQGRHIGFACSLSKKQFGEIIQQKWWEWLVSSGAVNISNELDNQLAAMTPEEIIETYYTALDQADFQMYNAVHSRRRAAGDLFTNMFDDEALFNSPEVATMWINNIESVKLLSVRKLEGKNCLPVYEALVDYRFVDPRRPPIPEGVIAQFVVVNQEIVELGWRIEEINSSPGVSQRLCGLNN